MFTPVIKKKIVLEDFIISVDETLFNCIGNMETKNITPLIEPSESTLFVRNNAGLQ